MPRCGKAPPGKLSNSREHGKTFPRQPQAPVFRSHAAKKTLLPRNRRYGNKNGKRPGFLKGRQPLPRRHRFRKFAWPRKKPSLSPASLSGALYLGLYKKRVKSYILFIKYQTIKYHTLFISAYEQRERQYPRKQLLPAAGQTICRLYGIRQKTRVNHQRAVYSGYHLFRSGRLHAGRDLRTPLRHEANRQRRHQKILEAGVPFFFREGD